MQKINKQQIVKISVINKSLNEDYVYQEEVTIKPNFFQKYILGKKEEIVKEHFKTFEITWNGLIETPIFDFSTLKEKDLIVEGKEVYNPWQIVITMSDGSKNVLKFEKDYLMENTLNEITEGLDLINI